MATTNRRVDPRSDRNKLHYSYEVGSAARALDTLPEMEEEHSGVGRQVTKNRRRAKNMSMGYVLFLSLICVASLFLCVFFLQQKSAYTTQNELIASKESQLNELTADNDAYYNQVIASVTLEDVKDVALNRLGLHYAVESQIQYYNTEENSYVRQYQDVPDEK